VLEGGRGKRGLVRRLPELSALEETRQRIAADTAVGDAPILLEEAVAIAQEIYLAVRIDGTRQCLELLVAPQGGEDVERAGALTRIPLDPLTPVTPAAIYTALRAAFPPDIASRLARYAARLRIARRGPALDQSAGADRRQPVRRLRRQGVRDDGADDRHDRRVSASRALEARHDAARTRAHVLASNCRDDGDVALGRGWPA
jgi:hypothetical protein